MATAMETPRRRQSGFHCSHGRQEPSSFAPATGHTAIAGVAKSKRATTTLALGASTNALLQLVQMGQQQAM